MNLTITELAQAVMKSETYVRQHIHRQHLVARRDGRRVFVALNEAVRWARERGLSFDPSIAAPLMTSSKAGRTARMTVLAWHAAGKQPSNLFTLIRHRRQDSMGPWAGEPGETWSSTDLGNELRLFSFDASFERCQAMVDRIIEEGTLGIDDFEVHYALEPVPRLHWAYRDYRPLVEVSMRSPFTKHSAKIVEYWSFATAPRERWLQVLELASNPLPAQFAHLAFPLDQCPDRVGNLMIAGAEDAMACDLTAGHDQTLNFHVDAEELLPGTHRATVWATHSGDNVIRQDIPVNPGSTPIECESDVDHIGFAIYRTTDGQCTDLMEAFLFMEVGGQIELKSGPTLHLHDSQGSPVHSVTPAGPVIDIGVSFDKDSAALDKGIRRQWLDRRIYKRETAARREGNLIRFQPDEFDQAVRYFIGLLRRDSDQTTPVYLADPYFMYALQRTEGYKLYLDMFAATTRQPFRILCTSKKNGNTQAWWLKYPKLITAHVSVRAFLKWADCKPAFHDRFLITPKREIVITHSINGWPKHGVTFISLPYGVYRAEAESLWEMEIESKTAQLLVREIG